MAAWARCCHQFESQPLDRLSGSVAQSQTHTSDLRDPMPNLVLAPVEAQSRINFEWPLPKDRNLRPVTRDPA